MIMSSEKLAVKVGELGGKIVNPLLRGSRRTRWTSSPRC